MKEDSAKKAYVEYLLTEGKSVVTFGNGDVIVTDSPRFPQEQKADGKKSCTIRTCILGNPNNYDTSMEHGATYYGGERQNDGKCVIKNYKCDDGTLVPI